MKLSQNIKQPAQTATGDVALFEGVGELGLDRLPKLEVGSYVMRLDKTLIRVSENVRTRGQRFAIIEGTVTKSEEGSMNRVGSVAAISLNTSWPSFSKTVTSLISSAAHEDPVKVTPERALAFFSDEAQDEVSGLEVKVRVTAGTSKSGHAFLLYAFSPL